MKKHYRRAIPFAMATFFLCGMAFEPARANQVPSVDFLLSLSKEPGQWIFQADRGSRALLLGSVELESTLSIVDLATETVQTLIRPASGYRFERLDARSPRELRRHLAFSPNLSQVLFAVNDEGGYRLYKFEDSEIEALGSRNEAVWDLAWSERYWAVLGAKRRGVSFLRVLDRENGSDREMVFGNDDKIKTFHHLSNDLLVFSAGEYVGDGKVAVTFRLFDARDITSGMETFKLVVDAEKYRDGEGVHWAQGSDSSGALFAIGNQVFSFDLKTQKVLLREEFLQVTPLDRGEILGQNERGWHQLFFSSRLGEIGKKTFLDRDAFFQPEAFIPIPRSNNLVVLGHEKVGGKKRVGFINRKSGKSKALVYDFAGREVSNLDEVFVAVSPGFDKTVFLFAKVWSSWHLLRAHPGKKALERLIHFPEAVFTPVGEERGGPHFTVLDTGAVSLRVLDQREQTEQVMFITEGPDEVWKQGYRTRAAPSLRQGAEGSYAAFSDCNLVLVANEPNPLLHRIHPAQ